MTVAGRKPDTSRWISNSLAWSCVISQPLISIGLSAVFACEQTKTCKVWALTVSLATTPAIVIYFLFLNLLRCFSSVGSRSTILFYSDRDNMTLLMLGFPIRRSPDYSLLTATRSLSQSSTSFIGNIRLGIHFVPLSTFLCIDLTSNCYSQLLAVNLKIFLHQSNC